MLLHRELTEQILAAFYEVYNELGYGFLERVYQNALFLNCRIGGFMWLRKRSAMFISKAGKSESILPTSSLTT